MNNYCDERKHGKLFVHHTVTDELKNNVRVMENGDF